MKAIYDVTLRGIEVSVEARNRFEALSKAEHKVQSIENNS